MDGKGFLKTLVEEISSLDLKNKDVTSGEFKAWHAEVLQALDRLFGSNSPEYRSFDSIHFDNSNALFSNPTYQRGLTQAEVTLILILKRLGVDDTVDSTPRTKDGNLKKVFLVHGRDKTPALELSRFLDGEFPIKTIFLDEQAWKGATLIEKLEQNSDVDYAFITLTPDDEGALKGDSLNGRARQNVIFEWGIFIGKLGREKITVLKRERLKNLQT